ncbi:hypothetical protein JB92DRAFT_1701938 [Gautieria morchelliformis]|nr:hypothetical protein JB92DRAFT_1701938 [Gautieria morchelliformis]
MDHSMDFTSPQLRSASAAVHLFGASILAYCLAARSQSGHVSFKTWRRVPWARWCIMLVFLDSWLFHAYAGLLIQGFGASRNQVTCNMAIYLCIIIYCLSKVGCTRRCQHNTEN